MAIHFLTSNAKHLLEQFDARIAQTEAKGKIKTWQKNSGGYYTHVAPEWKEQAWFKPKIASDRLTFNIVKSQDSVVTPLVYAYYHGHLLETFLNHFDTLFSQAVASAMAEANDLVK